LIRWEKYLNRLCGSKEIKFIMALRFLWKKTAMRANRVGHRSLRVYWNQNKFVPLINGGLVILMKLILIDICVLALEKLGFEA